MKEKGEINFLDIDEDNEGYYEVEIWESGDCDGHFFRWKRDAIRFFDENAKHPADCVKFHEACRFGGNCRLIKEF